MKRVQTQGLECEPGTWMSGHRTWDRNVVQGSSPAAATLPRLFPAPGQHRPGRSHPCSVYRVWCGRSSKPALRSALCVPSLRRIAELLWGHVSCFSEPNCCAKPASLAPTREARRCEEAPPIFPETTGQGLEESISVAEMALPLVGFFVGVLIMRALLFGVYIRAP